MGFSVTFGLKKVAEAGVEGGGEFGFEGFEGLHGELELFSPDGMWRSRPTLANSIKIVGQGGMKPGFIR